MIYTEKIKTAMKVAYDAHMGQTDKGGVPYIYHPMHLAEQLKTEDEIIVALLHDVVEDTFITFDDLAEYGFNSKIMRALKLLTHKSNLTKVEYMDYIRDIKKNKLATRVKIADLKHNMDLTRNNNKKPKKYDMYVEALAFLEEKKSSEG